MQRNFLNIVFNPFFQATVVAGLIILIIPLKLVKYRAEETDMLTRFDEAQLIFDDLDGDGTSEKICTFYNMAGTVGIILYSGNITLGQWNFKGKYQAGNSRLMMGDYNHNGLKEIYIFTLIADSVILQGMEYSPNPILFLRDRFIARLGKNLKEPDFKFLPGIITDMNNDSTGDLIFGISAGFSKQPRNIYIYDILHDSLKISPRSGAYINDFIIHDLDEDGNSEILLSTYTTDNFNEEVIPYSDHSAWMMVMDQDLNFIFPPVEFPGTLGSVQLAVMKTENGVSQIIGRYGHASRSKAYEMLFLADKFGNTTKKREIQAGDTYSNLNLLYRFNDAQENTVPGVMGKTGICMINKDLDIKLIRKISFEVNSHCFHDIDQDGKNEIIVLAPNQQQHLILRNDFTCPVPINFSIQANLPVMSVKLNGKHPSQLSIQGDRVWRLYNYGINPVYRFRFLIYLTIYLCVLGFILGIRKMYSFQLKKKYETEQKITRLQLSGIKAQMEPHFIMNTINTIGSSIYRHKPEDAYKLLLNFSGMVRSLLVSSDKLTRTLEEEVEFVKNYLELERSRFPELFDFSVSQDEEIRPETIIPKMIIQIHAENALKHGLLPKKSGGILDISISKDQGYLLISIKDNGIGRNAARKQLSDSTGKGMRILSQLFETYNKHNSKPLRQEIIDLYDDDKKPAGTMVKIFVPREFNEGIF